MKQLKSAKIQKELIRKSLDESVNMILNIDESFTKKISSKKNTDLISKPSFVLDNGVYILHETLGVKDVEGWNPEDNDGVIGILLIEDEHQLVVALEDAPDFYLNWSEKDGLVNRPVNELEDAKSDFNGEEYCRNLNSPDFPAAYYCLNYNKGGRSWYLPSTGELWSIYRHLEEIQNALSIVGGQEFVKTHGFGEGVPCYWSSTESTAADEYAWYLDINIGDLDKDDKIVVNLNVRPVSNFRKKNTLKESFTKKIKSVRKSDLNSKLSFVTDGVYILHETLGLKAVEGWNTKFNNGVIGILVVEDEHQLVVALEDSPNDLFWSKQWKLVNQPIKDKEGTESDFNGEDYCKNLNSPNFPAAYYCLNYEKGGHNWYLPSTGELWLIYRHLEEVQDALSIVGGQKFATNWDDDTTPCYWSSTERENVYTWGLSLDYNNLYVYGKFRRRLKVRPVSNFRKKNTLKESFTKKISSKKNTDLISKPSFVPGDGVYILHETLGVRTVEGWNPEDNDGVVGILLIEDDHKIVVALEDSPNSLHWSNKRKLVNQPVEEKEDVESDFNGEKYCRRLNSPDFTAAYYCLNYKKGGRNWYLPSMGELWLIYQHLEEIQTALSIVGGKKFVTEWKDFDFNFPAYWSSTEFGVVDACYLDLNNGGIHLSYKVSGSCKVRPVSAFSV